MGEEGREGWEGGRDRGSEEEGSREGGEYC